MSLSEKTKKWMKQNGIPSFKGKTVLITGANSGVGFKEAETVIFLGADVIMACRNREKAEAARQSLLNEYPEASITLMELDLADFESIDNFTQNLRNFEKTIDLFVNNAGVFHQPGKRTKDGFELVIGTNYFGSFYLSEKIVPLLATQSKPSIYVNTISIIHKIASVDYDDFYCEKKYGNFRVYGRSKISLAKYTYNLAMKYRESNVCVLMNHPGMAITPMGLNAFGKKVARLAPLAGHLINSPEKSALSVPYILSTTFAPGSIIGPNRVFGGWGYPKENHIYKKVKLGAEELIEFTQKEIYEKMTKDSSK